MVPDFEGSRSWVPIPPTQETVNTLFPDEHQHEDDDGWYEGQRSSLLPVKPRMAKRPLSVVWDLYYTSASSSTTRSSGTSTPRRLDASVLMITLQTSTDDRYFGDAWRALPVRGYTRIFENMLLRDPKITIKLNVDLRRRGAGLLPAHGKLVFTGPIDAYFAAQGLPKLEYRSLRFEEEFIEEPEDGFYQPAFVVNHLF